MYAMVSVVVGFDSSVHPEANEVSDVEDWNARGIMMISPNVF